MISVSRQEEPSSVVNLCLSTIHRVHVISSQDYHRIYLNKNLQLQMSCDYFSDYMRGFQWCHNRGSSLLSDLRQSSYKLQPFILIRTNRKIAGPSSLSLFLPCSSIGRLKALQIWSDSLEFGDGGLATFTLPCFDCFIFLCRKANVFPCFHKTI